MACNLPLPLASSLLRSVLRDLRPHCSFHSLARPGSLLFSAGSKSVAPLTGNLRSPSFITNHHLSDRCEPASKNPKKSHQNLHLSKAFYQPTSAKPFRKLDAVDRSAKVIPLLGVRRLNLGQRHRNAGSTSKDTAGFNATSSINVSHLLYRNIHPLPSVSDVAALRESRLVILCGAHQLPNLSATFPALYCVD